MTHWATTPNPTRRPWAYPLLTVVALGVVAALSHQSEGQRLRQLEQDAVTQLKSDLAKALEFASALQSASIRPPGVSASGDTLTFALPAPDGQVEELRLFVDPLRGGLCMLRAGKPAEMVAATVDGFKATFDLRSDGRPVLWMELSACQSRGAEPPLRHHLYRSVVLDTHATAGAQG
jgi:hypothetical protein